MEPAQHQAIHSASRISHGEAAELRKAMKSQEVGVVGVMGATLAIVKGRPAGGDDVLSVE